MADMNMVALTGRLTSDAKMKKSGELSVMEFTIAVNGWRKDRDTGGWIDVANFFNLTLFGEQAEKMHPYMTKGKCVSVEGSLAQERWNKDGKTYSRVKVVPSRINFMGGGSKNSNTAFYDSEDTQKEDFKAPLEKELFDANDGDVAEAGIY